MKENQLTPPKESTPADTGGASTEGVSLSDMSKPPAFQFYANDFIGSTLTWDAIACGMYIRLLCTQWVNGSIPDDQRRIARAAGVELGELQREWHLLEPKFPLTKEGVRKNPRLEAVRERQSEVSESRRKASEARWSDANAYANDNAKSKQRKVKEKEKVEIEEEGESESKRNAREPEIAEAVLWPTFKDWFDLYAKRRDMGECQAIWARLDQATHELIYRHTEAYVKAQPDKLYRKDPIRYLKKKGWLDEIITPSTNGTNNGRRSTDPADAARRTAEYFANKRAGQPVEPTGNT